jgi:hypothetical protein
MGMPPSTAWRLPLAIALAAAIVVSACVSAPRRAVPPGDLRRLVCSALALYGVGAIASLSGHPVLAGLVYAAGIMICALAVWLSRGSDSEDPPDGREPADERPPPEPDGLPELDWDEFERAFRAYSERAGRGSRAPVGTR